MKYKQLNLVSTLKFDIELHGIAKEQNGYEILKSGNYNIVVDFSTNDVSGMPEKKDGVIFVVSAPVFSVLKNNRDDVAMFDMDFTERDIKGFAVSQGGFIFSSDLHNS